MKARFARTVFRRFSFSAWCLMALAGGLVPLLFPSHLSSAPHVEADPNKSYPVTPEVGPWVILCASYSGEAATDLAREVALCLRRRDNLPAYVFDHGAQLRAQQEREIEEMKRQHKTVKKVAIPEQCGVVVGGFSDQDSALEALKAIKKLPPPEVDPANEKLKNVLPYQVIKGEKDPKTGRYHVVAINPFANSAVVPNPTIRVTQENKADPFLKELNEGEEYNLLKNRAPWTLVVQSFTGAVTIISDTSSQGIFGRQTDLAPNHRNGLEAGALQAREIARVMRQLKYDAYVLHTRQASIVAVGGFNGPKDQEMAQLADLISRDTRLEVMHLLPRQDMLALEVPRP